MLPQNSGTYSRFSETVCDLETCSSFADKSEAQCLSAVTELALCIEYHFDNIGQFVIRPMIFVHLRAHDLSDNLCLPNATVSHPTDHILYICHHKNFSCHLCEFIDKSGLLKDGIPARIYTVCGYKC